MVFHLSLSDSKSPPISRILISILAGLNSAIFWMFATRVLISNSARLFNNPLVTLPTTSITLGITITMIVIIIIIIIISLSDFTSIFVQRISSGL